MKAHALVAGAFLLAVGCASRPTIDRGEISGLYGLNRGENSDLLELRHDGTYTHSYLSAQGVKRTSQSRWSLEPFDGAQRITLEEFVFAIPGYVGSAESALWSAEIQRYEQTLRLMVDHDKGIWYQRRAN